MFETTILIAAFCLGLRAITDENKIGYPLRHLAKKLPKIIGKPLLTCVTCMASFWGTVIYSITSLAEGEVFYVFTWIACCISAAFINDVLWALRDWLIGNTPTKCDS